MNPLNINMENEMNSFVNAVVNQDARTENGMKARKSTANACVDLFFKAGAMRGQNIVPAFTAAYVEDKNIALRIAAWLRDARGGAGERQLFRAILTHLEKTDLDAAVALLNKVPELGRWDDLLVVTDPVLKAKAYSMILKALNEGNGLCAKWMPRKGNVANELRYAFDWTPKFYRKRLVELTKVVESQMCAKDWDNINFSHVPSLAAARYKKAFNRNTTKFAEYVAKLVKGDDPTVKVNAGAVFPYDVLKGIQSYGMSYNKTELDHIVAQWEALPNYVGDASILPMVDVSGSMVQSVGGTKTTAMDVAVSLGLYLADKNTGSFKDTFLTFSETPELLNLKGNVVQKMNQMVKSKWGMNTNLIRAIGRVLEVAKDGNVPQEDMPKMLLILSDMQFDHCTRFDDSAMQSIARQYEAAGYEVPKVVFWNIAARDNVPVKYDTRGVAMVSGFSPSIVKSVLDADLDNFTPEGIMLKTVMQDRYAV